MSWLVLIVAGLFEVLWASLLPETRGFTRLVPTTGFVVSLGLSMYLLSVATRSIPIGTGYAVWVGIGAVGTFAYTVVGRNEPTSPAQVVAIAALVLSIVAVQLTSSH